jgi:membrane fusion protein (multidrug efflux system)
MRRPWPLPENDAVPLPCIERVMTGVLCSAARFCVALLALAGCSEKQPPPAPPPPQVIAMQVIHRDTSVIGDLIGEVRAFREIELRPEVTGTVQRILFEPGQRVKLNEVLFVIDPRPYEAAVNEALAAVADAEADLARARQDVARYEPLLPHNAIPRATYDAAVATMKSTQALVDQRRATAQRVRLQLNNTSVRSPVNGQIGIQQVEVGALASAGQTVLATVSTLDPVYVHFSIPEADYVRFMRGRSRQALEREARSNPIELILPDGKPYAHAGTFDFADRAVSPITGTLALRGRFPNPQNLLRPGMSVRLRVVYEQVPNAILVPQRAVTELLGKQFVSVLDDKNVAHQRPITTGDRVGELWIVTAGLKPNERIIVDGFQKAPDGTAVVPTMITEAQLDNTPPPSIASPSTPPASVAGKAAAK